MNRPRSSIQRSRIRDRSVARREPDEHAAIDRGPRMPFGKYKGRRYEDMPADYLKWMVETFDDGRVKDHAVAALAKQAGGKKSVQQRTGNRPAKGSKPPRKPTDLSGSHYEWTHPKTGKVSRIPNDVVMDGREGEECPFDVSEQPEVWLPECELDREFMDIVGQ